ncbi:LysR family transcriptional regulator [Adlercreutzia caecimuris]|uniref:LysR family transcriptional regulator n=1 Tax=Adlercreutzia caecimuris TaxID=671266 RepID=A0A4S4G6I1_9ACTN|nr:LysR family transcriptional regulator [Adlercreutzia caecimuris]THG38724.1 LysR family transcriptional regulator [Adlercreutzia caecimuris]
MNIQQLRYIVAAIRLGGHASAARSLVISPQAISKAVSNAERHYRRKLFTREGRGVRPTAFALRFAAEAESVLARFDELEHFGQNLSPETDKPSTLSIALAVTPYRGRVFPEKHISAFLDDHPKIQGNILRHPSDTCIQALEQHVVDCAIILGAHSKGNYLNKHLTTISLVALLHRDHRLTGKKCLSLEDLLSVTVAYPDDIRTVYAGINSCFRSHGLPIPHYRQVPPLKKEILGFLSRGGVVLSAPDNPLVASNLNLTTAPIAHHQAITIPVCITFDGNSNNPQIQLFWQYLASLS